ncbi:MAG: ribosomal RNA small subunit methyltransferase A [Actinobacteria bacterium]|nr:ribosomal RNA small subunit methyltransferase A [Actinomycetota bacterium]
MSAAGGARAGGERGRPSAGDRSRPPRPHALRRYGQNHLVDRNVLHAIVDQAKVGADDVVLEVGAAGGLLTRPVLERARLVHAFEIDRRWLPRLEELAAAEPRLVLHAGDALRADLAALDPPPTAVVANLAYNIAIPLIMTTVAGLTSVRRWAVMVQRELGERLFAAPSTKAYAAVSVLTQLACRLEKSRPVPASAFRPRPRVESSFLTFVRRDEGGGDAAPDAAEYAAVSHLVRLAFGQRRKTLANSLGGAAHGGVTLSRDDVREALLGLTLGEAARPEELTPPQWRTFAAALGRPRDGGPAA